VKTDTTISNNKLDNVIRDNEKRTCLIIYIAISGNINVIKKKYAVLLPLPYIVKKLFNISHPKQ
jgi:hypothetical protein